MLPTNQELGTRNLELDRQHAAQLARAQVTEDGEADVPLDPPANGVLGFQVADTLHLEAARTLQSGYGAFAEGERIHPAGVVGAALGIRVGDVVRHADRDAGIELLKRAELGLMRLQECAA